MWGFLWVELFKNQDVSMENFMFKFSSFKENVEILSNYFFKVFNSFQEAPWKNLPRFSKNFPKSFREKYVMN
jgi:hypothetical protein